jgi:DNA-binding MarR family transcriptional regulator
MAMDRTTLTANLKPLERCGLVKIRADDRDRRLRRIVLTRTGRQLVARGYAIWKKVHAAEIRKLAIIASTPTNYDVPCGRYPFFERSP